MLEEVGLLSTGLLLLEYVREHYQRMHWDRL